MAFWNREKDEPPPALAEPEQETISPSGFVIVTESQIAISVSSIPEARIAKRECQAMKKELQLEKREVNALIAELNANRRHQVGVRGSMPRGRGAFPTIMREMERWSRDSARSSHANQLAPLDAAKHKINDQIRNFDRSIIEIDRMIHQLELAGHSEAAPPPRCPYCSITITPGDKFCDQCGGPL